MNLSVIFLLTTITIDAMGVGLIMPVMPDLIKEVTGGSLSEAALWGGVLTTAYAVMQFLFAPVLGNLSDWLGRRPVLLLSLFVMAADYVVMALAGALWLLLLGRLVGGITAASHATASATMADLSEPGKEAQGFGLISAGIGVGFILGPLVGGILGEYGTRAPFWAAAVLAGANGLLGFLVFKETVTDAIRRPFEIRKANPLGALLHVADLPGIGRGLVSFFLYQVSFAVYPAIWAYFCQARFGWDSGMIGLSLAVFGICMVLVQGVLIRHLIARLGNRGTALFGLIFSAVGYASLSVVTSGGLALILTPLAALGAAFSPALQAILAQTLGPARQGELQGVLGTVSAIAMAIAPLLMTGVFARFTAQDSAVYFPPAPFVVAMCLTGFALWLFIAPSSRRGTP